MTQQRLIDLGDRSVLPGVERLVTTGSLPQVRVTALATLACMNAATDTIVLASLHDPHPALRRLAVRLVEPRLQSSPTVDEAVRSLAGDPDPQVGAILDPNRAVEDKFVAYNVVAQDGRSVTGLVQVESADPATWLRRVSLRLAMATRRESTRTNCVPRGRGANG